MEFQKKSNLLRESNQHDKSATQKQEFFQQVFKECGGLFKEKEFEFFCSYMVPQQTRPCHKIGSNESKSLNNITYTQRELDINDINPHLFTGPRRQNFQGEYRIKDSYQEKQNRRILTTPTQKLKYHITIDNYNQFQLYRKMKKQHESFGVYLKNAKKYTKSSKMYSPTQIFYPTHKTKVPQTVVSNSSKRMKNLESDKIYFEYRKENERSTEETNLELIPRRLIQGLKFTKKGYNLSKSYKKLATTIR